MDRSQRQIKLLYCQIFLSPVQKNLSFEPQFSPSFLQCSKRWITPPSVFPCQHPASLQAASCVGTHHMVLLFQTPTQACSQDALSDQSESFLQPPWAPAHPLLLPWQPVACHPPVEQKGYSYRVELSEWKMPCVKQWELHNCKHFDHIVSLKLLKVMVNLH